MHVGFGLVAAQAGGSGFGMLPVVTILLMFAVLYLLILRPQAKQQKERQAMLKRAQKGDRIVTTGGLYGNIVGTKGDDTLIVKIADNVKVELARPAVASIVSSGGDGTEAT